MAADLDALAEQAVDAIADIYGRHEGHRAVHAKGTLWAATFTATTEASALTRAAHMQGEPVRATVRFSNGGGDPGAPDYAQDGRGIAVKMYLPDGSKTDLVGITLPVFFVRTPQDFVDFTRARRPDPDTGQPDLERVGAWLGEHHEALPAIQAALSMQPPASYARCLYNGLHSFRYLSADGEGRWVRWSLVPEAGEASLEPGEARERGADYLQQEMAGRLASAPAAFDLVLALGEDGDPIDDPTAAWPDERERVVVGRLEITGPDEERERGDDILVFDPTRVVDGIELSGDQILNFRPRAYSVSVTRRSGAPAPAR